LQGAIVKFGKGRESDLKPPTEEAFNRKVREGLAKVAKKNSKLTNSAEGISSRSSRILCELRG
jgi:hypothetical protein